MQTGKGTSAAPTPQRGDQSLGRQAGHDFILNHWRQSKPYGTCIVRYADGFVNLGRCPAVTFWRGAQRVDGCGIGLALADANLRSQCPKLAV